MFLSARFAACICLLSTPAAAQDPATWRLVSLNGADFGANATMSFLPDGTLQGEGPCNSFGGQLAALPPAWSLGPVRSTRMACDALEAEAAFFALLSEADQATAAADTLLLSRGGQEVLRFILVP